ncbi:MAG: porin [Acidobacteriota bacterium]|nr:porin [Acidobacteriota bacterium]
MSFTAARKLTMRDHRTEGEQAQGNTKRRVFLGLFGLLLSCSLTVHSQDQPPVAPSTQPANDTTSTWEYGGFIDVGYLHDFNYPVNHLFRGRGTTFHVNEGDVNMAAAYLRKKPTEQSRWGVELTAQAGKDTEIFGYSATAPVLGGVEVAEALRHLGPANVSYLAPVGKGLTIQGGIFSSLIGYDSLYAKDNLNYTRPWGADFTPYLMLGVNASYPVNDKITLAGFVVNGYWHLADANAVPSFGGQIAYKPTAQWTIKQTGLMGPHQAETSFEFWRYLSDTILEWKRDPVTVAFEFIGATEKVATLGEPQAAWVSAQLPVKWQVTKRWALAARPEVAWDSEGRWTLAKQTVKALTTTVEYRFPVRKVNTILRLEHRIDDSRGPQGGFFDDGYAAPGIPRLKPTQNLLIFGTIFTFDGTFRSGRQ